MDDFGTGYSSLSYLARFPFNKIKIDRQFMRNMTRDPAMRAIVKTIIALGKSLDVTITAEGVETEEQAAMLREFGCPQVQGFLYGYPGAAESGAKPEGKVTPISGAQQRRLAYLRLCLAGAPGREQPAQSPSERGNLGVALGRAANPGLALRCATGFLTLGCCGGWAWPCLVPRGGRPGLPAELSGGRAARPPG